MANELVVIEAMKEVCSTVNTLVSSCKKTGMINKAQMRYAAIKIDEYLQIQRSNAVHAVANNNIRNIQSTFELIKGMKLEGAALTYAMRQLDIEVDALERILEEMK